jgi:hypothetical protein
MQPHLRDVPALVISKNSQKPFDSFDEKIKNHLNQCTPSLTDILQVAKQYGVHNVKEIITDLVRVQSLYKANWDF